MWWADPVNVRRLQRKLWAAAKQSPERRFHALYDRVRRGDVLWEAWERVRKNRGAAGVDKVTLAGTEPARRAGRRLDRRLVQRARALPAPRHHPLSEGSVTMPGRSSVSRMRENRTYGIERGMGKRAARGTAPLTTNDDNSIGRRERPACPPSSMR